jgi:hypothetical protein
VYAITNSQSSKGKREKKKMAKIGKDGPSQESANLQIEQKEQEQEQEEQEEETGQQVRSKGSTITRPAMMGGEQQDKDIELSTRRQKRCVCITSSTPLFQLASRMCASCVYISRVVVHA